MRRSFKHVTSALLVVTAVTFVGPGSHGLVSAAQAVDPSTLIPPPPAEFNPVCKAVGAQTICDVTFNDPPVVAERLFEQRDGLIGLLEPQQQQTEGVEQPRVVGCGCQPDAQDTFGPVETTLRLEMHSDGIE